MDWTQMLLEAGIPEPPGRDEAYRQAALFTEERYKHKGNIRVQESNTRKTKRKPTQIR